MDLIPELNRVMGVMRARVSSLMDERRRVCGVGCLLSKYETETDNDTEVESETEKQEQEQEQEQQKSKRLKKLDTQIRNAKMSLWKCVIAQHLGMICGCICMILIAVLGE